MQKETGTEPITQEDSEVIKESQRVMKIKVMVTIAAILLLVLAAILLWDSEEGYLIKIATDDDQTWTYEIADTSILKNTGVLQEDGEFRCTFEGLKEGNTEISMCRASKTDPQSILEKRVYHVTVLKGLSVMQTSVEREVYED